MWQLTLRIRRVWANWFMWLYELVYVVASKEASFALPIEFVPVDAAVVGIVDDVDDRPLYDAEAVDWKVFVKYES